LPRLPGLRELLPPPPESTYTVARVPADTAKYHTCTEERESGVRKKDVNYSNLCGTHINVVFNFNITLNGVY
jgi:hypothetical protein